MAKPGSENMTDWINHHLGIGFDHIFIYNSGAIDGFKSILDVTPIAGAEVVDFPYNHEKDYKIAAYAHCYRTHRNEYDWMAFIDPNEYIMLAKAESVKEVFANGKYRKFECVRLNIVEFSNYGQLARDFCINPDNVVRNSKVATTKKMAKSIVNCKSKGLLMGAFAPTRNKDILKQCLPNVKEVVDKEENATKKGTNVNKISMGTIYLTTSQLEVRWKKWKKAKGY